jgi:2-oxoglutarate ferredoxin oxidoreductase subunit beta
VFSPCVTYNKHNTHQWFKERVYKLEETDYDPTDYERALVKVREWGDQIPIGLCYQTSRPTYEDGEPALKKGPLAHHKLGLTPEQRRALVQEFL